MCDDYESWWDAQLLPKDYLSSTLLRLNQGCVLVSIHQQPKASSEEQSSYKKLQALNRYHKLFGVEAVLHKREKDRKAQVNNFSIFHQEINKNPHHLSIFQTQICFALDSVSVAPESAKSRITVYIYRGRCQMWWQSNALRQTLLEAHPQRLAAAASAPLRSSSSWSASMPGTCPSDFPQHIVSLSQQSAEGHLPSSWGEWLWGSCFFFALDMEILCMMPKWWERAAQ